MLTITRLIAGSAAALAILVVACTTTTTTTTNGSSGGSSSGGTNAGEDAGETDAGTSDASDETPGDDGPKDCSKEEDLVACEKCCGVPEATLPFDGTYLACACDNPCKDACATTVCADIPEDPDDACVACLDSDTTAAECLELAQTVCDADPTCTQAVECLLEHCADDAER